MSLPPSALTLLDVLATRGPLTHKQLVDATPLPARTLRYALRRLRDDGRVVERPSFRDMRQSYYALTRPAAHTETALVAHA